MWIKAAVVVLLVCFLWSAALGITLSHSSRWISQLSPSTTTSKTHQLCTFTHSNARSHTQPGVHLAPSLPRCVFLSQRAAWQPALSPAAARGSNHDWWPVTHMTTHTANEQMHGCAVSTHTNTVPPCVIEVSGVSAVCVCLARNGLSLWTDGCGDGLIAIVKGSDPRGPVALCQGVPDKFSDWLFSFLFFCTIFLLYYS